MAGNPTNDASSARPAPGRPMVLVVEDSRSTQDAICRIFARMGWEVQSALTVAGGLALLALGPDAVILDLMLPDGDGLAVLRKVRDEGLDVKVVVASGVEDSTRLAEVRALRPDALLRKPVELDDLLRAVGAV